MDRSGRVVRRLGSCARRARLDSGGSAASIVVRQSCSSVDPPPALIAVRSASSRPANSTMSSVSRSAARSRRRPARAGLDPSVVTAIVSGPLRAIAGRMNVQLSGRSAAFTQIPAAVASAATAASTSGIPVAVMTSRTPSRSADSKGRIRRSEIWPSSTADSIGGTNIGSDDVDDGSRVRQARHLAGGDAGRPRRRGP